MYITTVLLRHYVDLTDSSDYIIYKYIITARICLESKNRRYGTLSQLFLMIELSKNKKFEK